MGCFILKDILPNPAYHYHLKFPSKYPVQHQYILQENWYLKFLDIKDLSLDVYKKTKNSGEEIFDLQKYHDAYCCEEEKRGRYHFTFRDPGG